MEVIQRIFHEEQLYDIDKETLICTPNTWFAASQSKLTHIRIGTKICQRNNTNDADKSLANRALANLIEGLNSEHFAPQYSFIHRKPVKQNDNTEAALSVHKVNMKQKIS